MCFAFVETAWGSFAFVARKGRVVATYLPQSGERLRKRIAREWPDAVENADALPRFQRQIVRYYDGRKVDFDIELDVADFPPFRRSVLKVCRAVPYGEVVTYADLAKAVGNPHAARAVGGAMASNPIPLIIPCHRVLRSDGSLGGFSTPGGLTLKERMLKLEADEIASPSEARRAGSQKRRPSARALVPMA